MKSRLLISLLAISTNLGVGAMPVIAKDLDIKKAGRQEKWLWAFETVSNKTPGSADKAAAFKIVQDEEAGLDKANNVQAAISYVQIVDFYRRAGEIDTAKAKEIKALGKIENAAASSNITPPELTRLAQAVQKMAGFHLEKGVALNRKESERAETLFLSSLNIGNKLPAKDMQRSQGYRSLIKFYLENNNPIKANTYTKELSLLMSGESEENMETRRPCQGCGRG